MQDWIDAIRGWIPGLIGAALAALSGPDREKLVRVVEVVTGFAVAYFCSDPLLNLLMVSSGKYYGGCSFLLGYFGLAWLKAGMSAISTLDIAGIIKSRLGGGK